MRSAYAGLPITDDDATIEAALEDVSIPTLMLSLVHITGDPELIRGRIRPQGLMLNEYQGFMSEEDKAEVRRLALPIIRAYRDRGSVLPEAPSPELIREMMSWLVCDDVPDEYLPMVLEEMELDDVDERRVDIDAGEQAKAAFPVVVIGCGESGLLAGIRLAEVGIPFTIVEKNAGPGGTWYENSYPGARVDVGNHFYCYSFEPSDHWTEFFAQQPELAKYFRDVMERRGIEPHIRFETEVTGADWDDETGTWTVHTRHADGTEDRLTARAVISAVGQLNRAHIPDIKGMHDFEGPWFHSSNWDHSVDYRGKKVALIGAGASGFQIAPSIAADVEQLTVFQRTAQWMFPNVNYHAKVGDGFRWALRHLPYYGRWFRFLIYWPSGHDGGLEGARVDPDYRDPNTGDQQRAVSERNEVTRQMFTAWIESQVGDDPELLAKVIPDYPATGKRTLQDNGSWLTALKRDNVELIRDEIDHIDAGGIVTVGGERFEADIIVYATGFYTNRMLWPMNINSRGENLGQRWGDSPMAYLGITVPGFPNLFCMYGPGTNLAHGGSLIFHSECQMRYIMGCFDALISGEHKALEPREDVTDAYWERLEKELLTLVWAQPSIKHTHFKNSQGRIHSLSPWRLVDYWTWTRRPNLEDFVIS
jgi:4-hydroxyacetophenone monooxygenase